MTSKVIASGKIVLIGSFISKGISAISSIVLARLLFENDYGALVLSSIFAGLITQIGGMGYEIYYLQYKGSDEEKSRVLDQVYNLRLVTNAVMFLVQGLIGLGLYLFTNDQMSGGILMLMAVSLMLEGFNAPQEVLLKSKMDFKKITTGNILQEFFATIAKLSGAFLGLGGLCFGIGPLIGSLTRLIYLRKVQKYKPQNFKWDKKEIKGIFNFGKHVLFGSAGMYLVQQIDRIFLTIFFPKNIVGQYGFAWSNAATPFNYIVSPQQQLILTYITRHKAGNPGLFDHLLTIQRLIGLVFFPIILTALLFTNEIVVILFSARWLIVVPFIKILLVYYTIQSVIFPFSSLLTGLGFPQITSRLTIIKAITLMASLLITLLIAKGQILPYLVVFCTVSISMDGWKAFRGIAKTSVDFKMLMAEAKYELILIFLILVGYFISIELYSTLSKILIIFILISLLVVLFFRIDKSRTHSAIKLILEN